MSIKELKRAIKGVFKPPSKRYYLGKLHYGTPYFWPRNFNSNIISIRKLQLKSQEEIEKYTKTYPYIREVQKFKNLPMVRRSKDWIFRIFQNYYWMEIGWPIYIYWHELGWKDKFNSPRHEWNPAFYIFFFHWQFTIHWTAPEEYNNDGYWEQILWYLYYSDKDIEKAEKTWPWGNINEGMSTWNKNYLI